jgi:hypothetical protein
MIRTRAKRAQQETVAPDVYPTEADPEVAADHGLHVADATCIRCDRQIRATDEVRKTATGGVVHLAC